ncbi:L-dopachrome tautomerase-related protein [Pseudoalteromonas sp. Hal273]
MAFGTKTFILELIGFNMYVYRFCKTFIAGLCLTALTSLSVSAATPKQVEVGTVEVVAELDVSPGNVAVSREGRIFSSLHPFRNPAYQLVEITGKSTYVPFPSEALQSGEALKSDLQLDSPLGVIFDDLDRLWVIDMGFKAGTTKLLAYDINTKKELFRFDISQELAPAGGSFVQDLAIDEINGFVYLADVWSSSIIVVDINKGAFNKIKHLPTMQAEDIDIVIGGDVVRLRGEAARINLDPITLSADRETLYYSAVNSRTWYQIPTQNIRDGESEEKIVSLISIVGEKPLSDGAATDDQGNHYFTNIQNSSIDVLTKNGELRTLKKHAFFEWPDSVRVHGDWLYVATNQIHKTPAFHSGKELGKPPFRVLKLKYR